MLRRPPTSIGLTPDDLAIFEKQYAQGQIYADHHESNTQHNAWEQRQDTGPPGSTGGSAGDAGGQAEVGVEERKMKSRDERIHGTTLSAGAGAGTSESGGARGTNAGVVQQGR
jgi:Anaphase-promoting complex APC subunit CDC26